MGVVTATCVFISCLMLCVADRKGVIPLGWESMCTARKDPEILRRYLNNSASTDRVIRMQCDVTGSDGSTWRFQTLRDWLNEVSGVSIFLQVRCRDGGKISLPFPMKAFGLIGLSVFDCIMTEKFADFGNPDISRIPDQLRIQEFRNSGWLSGGPDYEKIRNQGGLENLTSDYDCGQDSTIEYLVTNVSFSDLNDPGYKPPTKSETMMETELDFDLNKLLNSGSEAVSESSDTPSRNVIHNRRISDLELGIKNPKGSFLSLSEVLDLNLLSTNKTFDSNTTKAAKDEFAKFVERLKTLNLKCFYEKLRVWDESGVQLLPVAHFYFMVMGASFPELRVMNYSMDGIREFPQELQDFRVYFPKLEYLDLSRNYLTEVRLSNRPMDADGGYLTVDVRNNLIANISLQSLLSWSRIPGVFVDIRDNPVHCGCRMKNLLQRIRSDTFFVGSLRQYRYIRDLTCASPAQLRGQTLANVNLRCSAARSGVVPRILKTSSQLSELTRNRQALTRTATRRAMARKGRAGGKLLTWRRTDDDDIDT